MDETVGLVRSKVGKTQSGEKQVFPFREDKQYILDLRRAESHAFPCLFDPLNRKLCSAHFGYSITSFISLILTYQSHTSSYSF